jgi:chromate reductase, NAD(P)H dehydrogenase (quinone)
MKIIAFGASSSKQSINKIFAAYVAQLFTNATTIEVLDLNDYTMPLYTIDVQAAIGIPQAAFDFVHKLEEADLIIISLAEHNGTYTTFFKNIFDWASKAKLKMFEDKEVLLLSTAPGPRGGISALQHAKERFPIHGANIVGSFTLPKFGENFSNEVTNAALKTMLLQIIQNIQTHANTNTVH